MQITHETFMERALQLAALGRGSVSPNPMVGCVIVHENQIIGEGYHQQYGQAHAEVNAVNAVEDKSKLKQATVYVTLEPCSHFGKTPPCADLLVKHQVKRVVICNLDTFSLVNGQGIKKLQNAGIEVITNVLSEKGRFLNARFFTFVEKKRPYILLKWAESADGFIAKPNFEAVAISNDLAKRWVHRWRAEEDAIMVGTRTARYDNPKLNVRHWTGKNPVRIVIDRQRSLPENLHLFDGSQQTICYNEAPQPPEGEHVALLFSGSQQAISGVVGDNTNNGGYSLQQILIDLHQRKIQSVLVEGGTQLLQSFIDLNLWDEIRQIKSPKTLGEGIKAPIFSGNKIKTNSIGEDKICYFEPK